MNLERMDAKTYQTALLIVGTILLNLLHTQSVLAAPLSSKYRSVPRLARTATVAQSGAESVIDCAPISASARLSAAAAVIGISYEDLWLALHEEQTVAMVAAEQGISATTLIETMVEKETQVIVDAVANGCLSQAPADEYSAALPDALATFIHDKTPPWFITCRRAFHDRYLTAALLLNMDYFDLRNLSEQGHALVNLAAARAIDRQTLLAHLIDTETATIQIWASSGCVAEANAALWVQIVPTQLSRFLNEDAATATAGGEETATLQQQMYLPLLIN